MTNKNIYEEINLNQWQPLQTVLYDGWVLRFADGYTKRANSVNPLYFSNEDVHEKIRACEEIYTTHHLKTIFKITPNAQPANLDAILDKKGYALDAIVSIQLLDLQQIKAPSLQTVKIDDHVNDEWIEQFCQMSQVEDKHKATMKRMLDNQLCVKGFFTLYDDNKAVACALGMIERNYLGIFDVVTSENARNKGFGKQLLLNVLQWGKEHGATQSYLAVLADNQPALKLYEWLGYKEIYKYWYRVK